MGQQNISAPCKSAAASGTFLIAVPLLHLQPRSILRFLTKLRTLVVVICSGTMEGLQSSNLLLLPISHHPWDSFGIYALHFIHKSVISLVLIL